MNEGIADADEQIKYLDKVANAEKDLIAESLGVIDRARQRGALTCCCLLQESGTDRRQKRSERGERR